MLNTSLFALLAARRGYQGWTYGSGGTVNPSLPASNLVASPNPITTVDGTGAGSTLATLTFEDGAGDGAWSLTGDLATIAEIQGTGSGATIVTTATLDRASHDGFTGTVTYDTDSAGGTPLTAGVTLNVTEASAHTPDLAALETAPTAPSMGLTVGVLGGGTSVVEDGSTPMWEVTSVDHADAGLQALAGNSYATLAALVDDVRTAQEAQAGLDVAVRLPVVEAEMANTPILSGLGTIGLIGAALDGNGRPRTQLKVAGSNHGFSFDVAVDDDAHWTGVNAHLRRLRIGWFLSEEAAKLAEFEANGTVHMVGDNGVRVNGGRDLTIEDCEMVGWDGDGAIGCASEWPTRLFTDTRVRVYDSELYFNGRDAYHHNIYLHTVSQLALVRTLSYMARGGHCIKYDGPELVLIDSYAANYGHRAEHLSLGGRYSSPVNFTRNGNVFAVRSVMGSTESSTSYKPTRIVIDEIRQSTHGGISPRVPGWYTDQRVNDAMTTFVDGGLDGATHYGGETHADATGGVTQQLAVRRVGRFGRVQPPSPASPADYGWPLPDVDYDVRYIDATGTAQTITGVRLLNQSNHFMDLDLTNATPSTWPTDLGIWSFFLMKESAKDWDAPVLNPIWWNRAAPGYYWNEVAPGGSLDHARHDLLDRRHFTDCMLLMGTGQRVGLGLIRGTPLLHSGYQRIHMVPRPPMNQPRGATPDWPDVAGAAEWGDVLYDAVNASDDRAVRLGQPGTTLDDAYVWPAYIRDVSLRNVAGETPETLQLFEWVNFADSAGTGDKHALEPDCHVLMPDGSTRLAPHEGAHPITQAATEIDGAHAAGATQLTVGATAGMAAGQKVHLRYPPVRGRAQMLVTTVQSVDDPTTVTLADAIRYDLAGGEELATFAAAGTKPVWWNDGSL